MEFIKQQKTYKVKPIYLNHFLKTYWYIPSDVLQRGVEANIWNICRFNPPILDIGIGNGEISKFIFRNQPQIDLGIDIDEKGIQKARRVKKYKKVLCANAENMPLREASFNTVISNSTFEHITNDLKAVSEAARILIKGGIFFITVPSKFLPRWILEYEKNRNKEKAKEKLDIFNKRTNHLHYRSLVSWKRHFLKNNLKIVFYKYYFPEEVVLCWYKIFKIFTFRLFDRELWSYLRNSKIVKLIPKAIVIKILKNKILKNAYENGFFTNAENGAQLFIVAKKI